MKRVAETTDSQVEPISRSKGLRLTSHALFVLNATGLLLMGVLGAWARGVFEAIFSEFDVELPSLTIFILRVPGWAYLAAFCGLAALLLIKEILIKNRAVTSGIELCVTLSTLVILTLYCIGIIIPILKIRSAVA